MKVHSRGSGVMPVRGRGASQSPRGDAVMRSYAVLLGYVARFSLFGLTQALYAARMRQGGTRA
jgi:hypothetical protein